jgi:hypothetical protein
MGLDMYLTLNVSLKPEQEEIVQGALGDLYAAMKRINCVQFNAAYWRKANHIHKWFVDNVQEGRDDCQRYYVSQVELAELVALCREVQEHPAKAEKLLPTVDGFFFGSQDFDEHYWHDIQITIDQLTAALSSAREYDYFEYQASW